MVNPRWSSETHSASGPLDDRYWVSMEGKAGISRVSKRDVRVQPAFWRYDSMNVDDSYGIIIPLIYPMVIDLTLEVTKRDYMLLDILCCWCACCCAV